MHPLRTMITCGARQSLDCRNFKNIGKLNDSISDQVSVPCETNMVNLNEIDGLRPLLCNKMMVASLIRLCNAVIEAVESITGLLK